MLLAEKNADLMNALLNLCQENGIRTPEGIIKLMGEVQVLLKRIADINGLPIHEVLRLNTLYLRPPAPQHPEKTPDYATEPK